jgi:hypothetical protein
MASTQISGREASLVTPEVVIKYEYKGILPDKFKD